MSLKNRTASGVIWSSGARTISMTAHFIFTIVLIRWLTPQDFGLLAMAMVFIGFAQKFNDMGFGSALVQFETIRTRHASSIFWINIAFGSSIALVFWILADSISSFYNEPQLIAIIKWLSAIFLVNALGYVPQSLLQRHMKFDRLAFAEVLSLSISGTIALYMAYTGWGVWSLVAQLVIKSIVNTLCVWILVKWVPRLGFSFSAIKDMLKYSLGFSGFKIINYWSRKVDDLLVGRLMGSFALGIYDRAYQLMLHPITVMIDVISKVIFPALSSIKDQKERVKRIYLQTVSLLALIIFPMMIGLFVVAKPTVLILFGEQWVDVVLIIQILCPVAILQVLTIPTGWIYTSQGRTDWLFWWGVGGSGFLILTLCIGAYLGTVESVALSYTIGNIILLYPCIAISGSLIGLKFHETIREVAPAFLSALAMGVCVYALDLVIPGYWTYWLKFVLMVVAGVVIYLAIISGFRIEAAKEFQRLIREQWNIRRSGSSPSKPTTEKE